jgi:hypothetical protein
MFRQSSLSEIYFRKFEIGDQDRNATLLLRSGGTRQSKRCRITIGAHAFGGFDDAQAI